MTVVNSAPESASVESVVGGLVRAWNSGNAREFAGFFLDNADLVTIHGMHLHGRQSIAGLYEMLFQSVFEDSRIRASQIVRRKVCDDVELLHATVEGSIVRGPLAGKQHVLVSMLLKQKQQRWMLSSMHNTLVTAPRF